MLQRDPDIVSAIQALRAIAVIFVVLNDFFPAHLAGGYIGVDIFFVVSGFLISSHLLRELKGGSLNFSRFTAESPPSIARFSAGAGGDLLSRLAIDALSLASGQFEGRSRRR